MKTKTAVTITALIVLLAGGLMFQGLSSANANDFSRRDNYAAGPHKAGKHDRGERMAKILGLSDEQQEQIRAIHQEERATVEPLRKSLHDQRQQMHAATGAETFDETAVRALAAEQAEIQAELMVERARTENRVQAVLTPEQRELSARIRSMRQEERHETRRGFRGGDAPETE